MALQCYKSGLKILIENVNYCYTTELTMNLRLNTRDENCLRLRYAVSREPREVGLRLVLRARHRV